MGCWYAKKNYVLPVLILSEQHLPIGNFNLKILLENDDGSWSGMVGQLVRKEADICGGALNFTPKRSKVIDFGTSILNDKGTA